MGENVPQVDITYCRRLLAKAILFKSVDRVVAAQDFGGYKINITAYTVSKLVHTAGKRIDLDRIWRDQAITPALGSTAADLSQAMCDVIFNPLRGTHVGEWAKRQDCWTTALEIDWSVPDALAQELTKIPVEDTGSPGDRDALDDMARVMATPSSEWFAVARWAKETNNLNGWQRQLAYGIGRNINNGWKISDKQAIQAVRLMDEAITLGFQTGVPPA